MSDRKNLISDFEYAVRKADAEGWDFVVLTTEDGFEILNMLKEQEPRVLTLDELRSLDGTDHFVWLEDNGEYELYDCYAEVTTYRNNVELNTFGREVEFEPDNEEYGKTWRCWSARPTEEQRKAVKWG